LKVEVQESGLGAGERKILRKVGCRKGMEEETKPARPDPVGACGTHILPSD